MKYALSIDQGTSGSKAIIFSNTGKIIAKHTTPYKCNFFNEGFVEQKPEDIISSVLEAVKETVKDFIANGNDITDIICAGIDNQRESFLLWDEKGSPLSQVVVWQCKRSISICEQMKKEGYEDFIRDRSGLMLDPYFSGTKVKWIMDNIPDIYEQSKKGSVYFGTIDTWLLFNLTQKKVYKTDRTNASRTLFFNLDKLDWDKDLQKLFKAEYLNLPEICASSDYYGNSDFGGIFPKPIPINSMIGDSHSASFGEGCISTGTVKATMGTGSSVLMNTGSKRIRSKSGMVSSICWSTKDRTDYGLEGVIVSCGSTITWFQNQLGLVKDGKDFDRLATSVLSSEGVFLVPAFSGLGAPFWQMSRKAEIHGITFGTTAAHIVRAALESYPFQLKEVISSMEKDIDQKIKWLKADGGLTNSKLTMQYITQLLDTEVIVDEQKEASAYGAALLAFMESGILSLEEIENQIKNSNHETHKTQDYEHAEYIKSVHKKWVDFLHSN
ncbi:MAG: carbohydrate kinase [Treponema sp.]|nr:carbohydrate kinase [Treponema sp.]